MSASVYVGEATYAVQSLRGVGPLESRRVEEEVVMNTAPHREGDADDVGETGEQLVEQAGYHEELRRSLQSFSMFAIAFSVISITTGIFLNYGFGLTWFGPASIWT